MLYSRLLMHCSGKEEQGSSCIRTQEALAFQRTRGQKL